VVDDVITTGATAEACARVLKRPGAVRVCAGASGAAFGNAALIWNLPLATPTY